MKEEQDEQITSRPYGRVQAVRTRRKLFGRKRQEIFLEHLAATCNVQRSAEAAGVTVQCVYQRRARDGAFRVAWGVTLEQGYARLELRLLEAAMGAGETPLPNPSPAKGERGFQAAEEREIGPLDKELALHLLREHKRGAAAPKHSGAPRPKSADWNEVETYFIARLKALRVRIDGADGEGAPPPAFAKASAGSPPRDQLGEEL